jgi:methionine sulfoxide reductase heme-binding subunit
MTFTRIVKPLIFLAGLGPVGYLIWAAFTGHLSANPVSDLTNETGLWTLRFLAITLSITPIRRITGWHGIIRFRRMTGLFAFFYGTLHFLTYIAFDQSFAPLADILKDVAKRPFITVGFTAFVLMIPLALTSTAAMIRRLGRRWQRLHRLVYVSATAGVIHYYWLVKADVRSPLTYAAIVGTLLAFRMVWMAAHRVPARGRVATNMPRTLPKHGQSTARRLSAEQSLDVR